MQIDTFSVKSFPDVKIWKTPPKASPARSRICIATEEIIGPVRNGGIASTYYHLAKGLASRGHEVHVLYLKGRKVENETPEHWIEHFAEFGITLHYLEFDSKGLWGASVFWQQRYAAAFDWFREQEPFDVVHTSEWRGGLMYCLMAKQMGLAFLDTIFLVKTSSPHIWNRHYQMQPIQKDDLVAAGYAEQKCVELADMVIGGSAHLLRFMEHIGYKLPKGKTHVQPNIVDFSEVKVTDGRPPRKAGDVVKTDEVTFFGRLEGRKGVEIFCNALDILQSRRISPRKVNFMGKLGDALASQGGEKVEAYLNRKADNWPFEVEYITDLNQPEALSFLSSRDMFAVMPSLIENSTMAVYEALECRLPFIATAVGGTPELIAKKDHAHALVQPTSSSIADALERMLSTGQKIPKSSFSNAKNLETWFDFHAYIAAEQAARAGLSKTKAKQAAVKAYIPGQIKPLGPVIRTLGLIALLRDPETLDGFVDGVLADPVDTVDLVVTEAALEESATLAVGRLMEGGIDANVIMNIGIAAGEALNSAVDDCKADGLIVANGTQVWLKAGFAEAARTALHTAPNYLMTAFSTGDGATRFMPIGGDVASQFISARAYGPEFVAMTQALRKQVGPFEPYDVPNGIIHEFITRAAENHDSDLYVYARDLLEWQDGLQESRAISNDPVYSYLKAKPFIDKSSIAMRKTFLSTLDGGGGGPHPDRFRENARPAEKPAWLVHADRDRNDAHAFRNAKVTIGLDEDNSVLYFLTKGNSERHVTVNNEKIDAELLDLANEGNSNQVALERYAIPDEWAPGSIFGVKLELLDEDKSRKRFVRVIKLSENVFSATSGHAVPTHAVLKELFEMHQNGSKIGFAMPKTLSKVLKPQSVHMSIPDADVSALDAAFGKHGGLKDSDFELLGEEQAVTNSGGTNADTAVSTAKTSWGKPRKSDPSVRGAVNLSSISDVMAGELRGWAWNRLDRNEVVTVIVRSRDVSVASVLADVINPNLGNRTPGLENHAFVLNLDLASIQPNSYVQLYILETQTPLRNGRFRFENDILLPAQDEQPEVKKLGLLPALLKRLGGKVV